MRIILAIMLALFALPASAAQQLAVDLGQGVRTMTTRQLLARPDVERVDIANDIAYHRPMHYRAVPLKALLTGVNASDHLQFIALDGFAAEIDAAKILDGHGAQAWLAVEDPSNPWPALPGNTGSAGPFYLVWTHPARGHINPEQWPYQIARIRRLGPVAARFPALRPDPALPSTSPIRHGFVLFQRHCMACHTLNLQGDAHIGPDLNIPYNPTQYLRADLLRVYIRNPQSLRHWPQARMPGFDRTQLPDADLDALLDYLQHMAGRKIKPK